MTISLERRSSDNLWEGVCTWITSTEHRIYIGWFGVLLIPTGLVAAIVFTIAFIAAPPVDIDGIREAVSGKPVATWADIMNRANMGIEVIHERNAHNFPLDLAAGEAQPIAFVAPTISGESLSICNCLQG